MGTNSTGCTEWERDYDPMTEQPHTKKYADHISEVPTDLLAHNFVGSLIRAEGNLNRYKELTMILIRELRGEPHPKEIQDAMDGHAKGDNWDNGND